MRSFQLHSEDSSKGSVATLENNMKKLLNKERRKLPKHCKIPKKDEVSDTMR